MKRFFFLFLCIVYLSGLSKAQSSFWEETSLSNVDVSALAVAGQGEIFAGTSGLLGGNIVYRSTDQGVSWTAQNEGFPTEGTISITSLAVEPTLGFFIYAGTYSHGLYSGNVLGSPWQLQTASIPGGNPDVRAIKVRSSGNGKIGDDIIIGTTSGIFRSTDTGSSWTELNNGLTVTFVLSLMIDEDGVLFVGTANAGGIFRSTDQGANWTPVNNGLPLGTSILSIESLTLTSNRHILAGTEAGVFRSTDRGESWTVSNNGIGNNTIHTMCIARSGEIYAASAGGAASSGGVFRSIDDGNNWNSINTGLTLLGGGVSSLAIDSSGYLYAGGLNFSGPSVFRSVQPVTAVSTEEESAIPSFSLSQNYPNPFNPSTIIRFSLPKEEFVSLKVHDLLGREVVTLLSQRLEAGEHSMQWNATGIPSGVYFYWLESPNYRTVKKMLLVK